MTDNNNTPSSEITLCASPEPLDIARFMVKILDIKKAKDIKLLYVEDQTSIADYFVLCTGTSKTQISSLAEEVEFRLSQNGVSVLHNEGGRGDTWILSDYGSIILHVFSSDTRDYYKIEKLYKDGSEVDISNLLTAD